MVDKFPELVRETTPSPNVKSRVINTSRFSVNVKVVARILSADTRNSLTFTMLFKIILKKTQKTRTFDRFFTYAKSYTFAVF